MERCNKINLIILFGGKSTEHDVSKMSAYNIINAVDREKYNISTIGISRTGQWYLFEGDTEKIKNGEWENCSYPATFTADNGFFALKNGEYCRILCDVVFPAVHGGYCEDGRLQGLFDMCEIKYVGSGCSASAVCMDKFFTKSIVAQTGVPQADFVLVKSVDMANEPAATISNIEKKLNYPVFVKPANAGSSVGVSKARSHSELITAISTALKYDSKVLVEEFINGREIEVAVMGNGDPVASVCGEINPGADFYDYDTKYNSDTARYFIPARISEKCANKVRYFALKIYESLGCLGLSRVDFFVDKDENIVFNEINTLPGFTSISMYPSLFMHSGMTYSQIIDKLIALALEERQ